jgi:hypothetical protein
MQALRPLSLIVVLFVAFGATPASAQQSSGVEDARAILSSGALDAALAGHELAVDQQRGQLDDLLASDEVREIAGERGIDMGRVESAAAGLSDAQVRTIFPLVANLTAQDRGGLGTVTISVAALIIILLVLILVS